MAREILTRKASDNEYLHKDFHGALSAGIEYLDRTYGGESVREYLRSLALSFYAPVIESVRSRGLAALKEHFEQIYAVERAAVRFDMREDELVMYVEKCPAVEHMRKQGYLVARLFVETDRVVNEVICEGSPFSYEMISYDPWTGRSTQRFFRRQP